MTHHLLKVPLQLLKVVFQSPFIIDILTRIAGQSGGLLVAVTVIKSNNIEMDQRGENHILLAIVQITGIKAILFGSHIY